LEHAHEFVRQQVSFAREDRIFADDIRKIKSMIESFSFMRETDAFAKAQGIELNKGYESFSLNN
jgi:histidine ammonia-lyase